MKKVSEILEYDIYPNLNVLDVLDRLSPIEKGDYYQLACPNCEKREAYVYKGSSHINCSRLNKCGYSISIWDFLQQERGWSNRETLEYLASASNVILPNLGENSSEEYAKRQKKSSILHEALNIARIEISKSNNPARKYMLERGYTENEINDFEVGSLPPIKDLKSALLSRGFSETDFNESGLTTSGFGDKYLLAIPYRSGSGAITGFIVRALNSDVNPKYKFSFGIEKQNFFNIDRVQSKGHLIIVEGFLDALNSAAKGVKNIVATGGAIPTEQQINNAINRGFSSFILALDNDSAGFKGMRKTIERLTEKGVPVYVAEIPDEYKDPDELISKNGIDSFKHIVKNAESASKWMADDILSIYNLTNEIDRKNAKNALINFALSLKDSLDIKYVLDKAKRAFELDEKGLEREFAEYYHAKNEQAKLKDYHNLIKAAEQALNKNNPDELKEILSGGLRKISGAASPTIDVYTSDDFLEEIKLAPATLPSGYVMLDRIAQFMPGAISIIAGRPRHGKTTFLMNLALNQIRLQPDKTIFFFSYEEARKDIIVKMINILADYKINNSQNVKQIEYYLRGWHNGKARTRHEPILEALENVKSYISNDRMKVIDSPLYVDELCETMRYMTAKYDIGAIFIDYIQKIKIKGKFQSRQIELQKVSEQLLELAKELNLPLIMGAQFNREASSNQKPKMEHLRESGDIENDANLIIGLYNNSVEDTSQEFGEIVDLELSILKNRNGKSNEKVMLQFDRPKLRIFEDEPKF